MNRITILAAGFLAGCTTSSTPTATTAEATETAFPSAAPTTETTATTEPAVVTKPTSDTPAPADAVSAVTKAQNELGFRLWKQLRKGGTTGNLSISPTSIASALSMAWAGAEGETAAEMKDTLGLPLSAEAAGDVYAELLGGWQRSGDDMELKVVNRLFPEKTLKVQSSFLEFTKAHFGAPAEPLDYKHASEKSRKHINAWVEKQTHDRIENLISPRGIDDQTRMVLVNALYMKAKWTTPFQKALTKNDTFWAGGEKEIEVSTMHRTGSMRYADAGDVALLELPYRERGWSMVIALPDDRKGLAKLEDALSVETTSKWFDALSSSYVRLSLPKFELDMTDSLSLKGSLIDLGMKVAFDRGQADFTGIAQHETPDDRLFIGDVVHKTFVAIDEVGTEAAAATAVVMPRAGSAMPSEKPIAFEVDRPFLFFIRDANTGAIFFTGRVVDPS